jgi:proline iminopeptidase
MAELFPEIEPHAHGMLDAGDGQRVYWESCGNPRGKPALVVHGGPGIGCTARMRRAFDPERYRIVLFDQRGCGRSRPHASELGTELGTNTTQRLLGDMERLRMELGIERWLLSGGSWGVALALAYAEEHPERVTELVLSNVTLCRRREIDWLYRGVGRFFPEEWRAFAQAVPPLERHEPVAAYARLMERPETRDAAALAWARWEDTVVSLEPGAKSNFYGDRPHSELLAFVRLAAHYFAHSGFFEDEQLLRNAGRLSGIPGVLIHGRLDLSAPLESAWELAESWPGARLHVVEDGGHQGNRAARELLLRAHEEFARG